MKIIRILSLILIVSLLFSCKNKESESKTVEVKIGFVAPLTGPLAAFGESSDALVSDVTKAMNSKKLNFEGKEVVFKVYLEDGQSNPTKSAEVANKLINQDQIDLMVVAGAPPTVSPVAAVCESKGVPCVSGNSPLDSWLAGGPYNSSFHFFWGMDEVIDLFVNMWDDIETNKKVGGMWASDADGVGWANAFVAELPNRGYQVNDLGRFPLGTSDYTSFIQTLKNENIEILTGNMPPPDFAAFWRQCKQMEYTPKIVTVGKALLFPAAVGAIGGELPEGLSCEIWWSPEHPFSSSLTGVTAEGLANSYGKQWSQTTGFSHAIFEVAFDAVKRASSLNRAELIKAISETNLNTIVGSIKFNDQNYSLTPLVGGQWTKGETYPWELKIVENSALPDVKLDRSLVSITSSESE